MRRGCFRTGAIIAAAWCAVAAGVAQAADARRIALIIGNSTYKEAPLRYPVNDARGMATGLRARGFEVLLHENASKRQMETAIADFGEKLSDGATGLFFYTGHGMQVNGRNYLIPVDAAISSEQRVRIEATDVDLVLEQMSAARAKVSIVILDASRANPFERRFRSAGSGLAQIDAPDGTLIAYAVAPGKVTASADDAGSLYTREILKVLATPGLKVEDVFKQVRINVSGASRGTQIPWEASSLTSDFYFIPPVSGAADASGEGTDISLWNAVKDSSNAGELRVYLRRFPNGLFAGAARTRIAELNAVRVSTATQEAALQHRTDATFEGRYAGTITGSGRIIEALLEIERSQISGFGSVVMGDTNSQASRICRIRGRVRESGEIDHMDVECGAYSWRFSGRFARDNDGRYAGTTTGKSYDAGDVTVLWKRASGS